MRLEAKVGTLKIIFENPKDLEEKLLKEKDTHEKLAVQIQAEWEKAEKPFKEKMRTIRKNLGDIQKALIDLAGNSSTKAV
jgi:hypothetical protein